MKTPEKWIIENNQLARTFELNNFVEAIEFVNKIVPIAESADHHPDIEIFGYKKVKIKLMSHDVGEITDKDVNLAEKISSLAD
ncbi:4a-hydroxytetrahydrobiopterin dehydratase [Marinilabilia salmonicolor]|jgi:4a-hydroxytetrahydrobiopterin dehydratase|uniref:4a-hydroxytetrahydrobiopterin dehydratase n=1 Tax=Marinilabilia salmonicolor TaxID=989 RepID=A0A368VCS8_9BACT|nr:4a-hydroxytetrahydrobiopterin dehydratase [Marinilabilia salmonicolor]RCW37444.1 pterin-4-alpha-carbinolamine dehydratase [Marinilabilia salmonicolor]